MPLALALASAVALCAVPLGTAATRAGARPLVQPARELALLYAPHTARARPERRSPFVQRVSMRRPLTGERTSLPVTGQRVDPNGKTWLRVLLPGRPNGHTGWIVKRSTAVEQTPWHIVVHTGTRRVVVYRAGRAVRTMIAIVGASSTPTPHGSFFVEEAIELPSDEAGAPYALALSARSTVLQEFAGGPGQIALHGLMNVGGVLGTAVSHGCVRLDNGAMHWLVVRMGGGVPVTIEN